MGWLIAQTWFLLFIAFLLGALVAWLIALAVTDSENDVVAASRRGGSR